MNREKQAGSRCETASEPPHPVDLLIGKIASAHRDVLHAGTVIRSLPPDHRAHGRPKT